MEGVCAARRGVGGDSSGGHPGERRKWDPLFARVMAQAVRLRKRRRLRRKEAEPILTELTERFGMTGIHQEIALEEAQVEHRPVYLLDGRVVALQIEEQVAPGLRGLLMWPASRRWVTVDMGAVRFVTNGADIMAPGITAADPEIGEGDVVWVRDETHGRPLAVGTARVAGPGLPGEKGKVVANHHAVGDALWLVGEPERE